MTGNYKQYRRTQIVEMTDWVEGFDMTDVSVSSADKKVGSPKIGNKIAIKLRETQIITNIVG